ncbi:MAG: hypothetical protein ABI746_02635 [Dermatophilaceae bacterium]
MTLHCPVTLLLVGHDDGPLDDEANTRLRRQAKALWTQRIAAVYAVPGRAADVGHLAAQELGVSCHVAEGLDQGGMHEVLQGIADLYRGERVLVVGSDALWARGLPGLAVDRSGRAGEWGQVRLDAPVPLEIGDEGWTILPAQT